MRINFMFNFEPDRRPTSDDLRRLYKMNYMDLASLSEWAGVTAAIATTISIPVAAFALLQSRRQAQTDFEDNLNAQYRATIREIPIDAHLGKPLNEDCLKKNMLDFYHYIDLTNEQVFLRMEGRVSTKTWRNWCDGISNNLAKPGFAEAWKVIKVCSENSFNELRRLESDGYKSDPKRWT